MATTIISLMLKSSIVSRRSWRIVQPNRPDDR
jgi:hypothetical protein